MDCHFLLQGLPNPGIEPGSPALQADALPSELPEQLYIYIYTHTHTHTHSYEDVCSKKIFETFFFSFFFLFETFNEGVNLMRFAFLK